MKRIFLLIFIIISVFKVNAQLQVSYYVQGDADDWQLFMSQKLVSDLEAGGKTIVITLTAGDEGYGNTIIPASGSSVPYYLAKERGAVYSSKFVSDFYISGNNYPIPTAQTVVINGKSIIKYFYGNVSGFGSVVNYFLRLPDGGPSGDGYPTTGNKSLKKLKVNGTSITSVDGAATYNSWAELAYTIYSIIFTEKGLDLQVWLNTSNLNPVTNPNDYPDHFYSSTAAQDAVATRLWVGIEQYIMDYSSTLPATLTNEEYETATAAFNLYDWSLVKNKYPSKFTSTTRAWLSMDYSSTLRFPTGSAPLPITLLDFTGKLKGNNVLLEWSTSAEINSKEFQIEKSNDGVIYRKLSTIPAAGNSTILKKYNYLDIEATELNYYRLKMVDLDGFNKQSNVVIVKNSGVSQTISAVNNPFADHINIRFVKLPKGVVSLKLMDISGKLISTGEIYNPLSSIIRFDYNKLISKGLYILRVENDGKQYSIKLLRE